MRLEWFLTREIFPISSIMNKIAYSRFILCAMLAFVFTICKPSASISQTASMPRVPCPAVTGHTLRVPCPAVNSRNLPSQTAKQGNDKPLNELSMLYDCGHPTDEEQLMLELINRARANPDSEGIRLKTTTDQNILNSYSYFGTPTPSQVESDFSGYPVRPPLAFNTHLITAARGHDNAMITYDSQYHVGPDGDPGTRMANAGYVLSGGWGENVFAFGNTDIWYDDASFLIDFGNPGLGHRHNIMNFATDDQVYTEVGIGIVHGMGSGNPNGDVGPVLTTEDFAVNNNENFVLGVVYSDLNDNGFYDEGEGDSGVKITLSSGSNYYAVSSGSGGYAIPFTGNGIVTITATGGPFATPVQESVNLNGQNVKVDFSPNLTGYPTPVSLVSPTGGMAVPSDTVDFIWDTMAVAASYHIEIATDSLFKKIFKNDSGIKSASIVFSGLKDTTTYYWRVQAKNAKGVGGWSSTASFFIQLPQPALVQVAPPNGADVGDSIIEFIWHSPGYTTIGYDLIVCSDKAMMDTAFTDMPQDTTDVINPSDFNLNAGQTYYWEVLAQGLTGWSNPSSIRSFVTATASVSPTGVSGSASITISPNPSSGSAELQFTLPTSEDVSLRVFNSLGQQVQSLDLGRFSPGSNNYVWDASTLPAGSYACQLRMGDQIENARVVILK
jgi:hypothetical protein